MHTKHIDKQNLHNNPENFPRRELDSEIDNVIKEEKEGGILHINNPILYSQMKLESCYKKKTLNRAALERAIEIGSSIGSMAYSTLLEVPVPDI